MGLEMDNNNIGELVEEYSQELTTEKLMELHWVSQQEAVEKSLSEEEKNRKEDLSSVLAVKQCRKVDETSRSNPAHSRGKIIT
ncbi:hypothetical protein AVEN_166197-1 [Araneus ventricosus]|uniref:Uncharacterized protein n=1 Tax=Araneus ventricosus TaxID=182803 RepID=A0A4Y2DB36_ARAVE|nr:hypothetical protein AVEN_166197-1 [Araneus ventricosus]